MIRSIVERLREIFGGGKRLGLELGTGAGAAVEVDDEAHRVTAFGASPHPGHRGKELGLWLRRWVPTIGATSRNAHAAILDGEMYHFIMRLPPMTAAERRPAVRREIRQQVSTPIEQLAWAHHDVGTVTEDGAPRQVVLVGVARRQVVDDAVDGLRAADLEPTLVTTVPMALTRAARLLPPQPGGVAVAYLAAGRSFLIVFQDGALELVREFSLHGEVQMKDRDELAEELSAEVRRSFLYFGQRARGAKVDRLVMCGTLPQLRELTGPLVDSLGVDVELYDSAAELDLTELGDGAATYRSIQPALAVALGAAALPEDQCNLLPEEVAGEPRRRALRVAGLAAAAVIVVLLAGWYAFSSLRVATRESRLESLESDIAGLRVELEQARSTRRDREQHRMRQLLLQYRTQEPPLLASTLQSVSRLVADEMVFRRIDWERRLGPEGEPYWNARVEGLVLGPGRAQSQQIFTQFFERLKAAPTVESVEVVGGLAIGTEDNRRDPLQERREALQGTERTALRRLAEEEGRGVATPLDSLPLVEPNATSVSFTVLVKLRTVEADAVAAGDSGGGTS